MRYACQKAGVHHVRVGGIEHQVAGTGGVIAEQHLAPVLAAVGALEHATLGIGPEGMSLRRHPHDLGIGWMHAHAADVPRVLQPEEASRCCRHWSVRQTPSPWLVLPRIRIFAAADVHDVGIRRGRLPSRRSCHRSSVSVIGVQVLPPSVVLNTPPPVVPIQYSFGRARGRPRPRSGRRERSDLAPAQRAERRGVKRLCGRQGRQQENGRMR